MVYRRASGTGWQFQARTRHGWKALTFRGSKPKAARLAELWEELAQRERAWDILDPILASPRKERQRRLGQLLDLWTETRGTLGEVRRRLHDPDLEPQVAAWEKVYRKLTPKSGDKTVNRVRHFFPAGKPRLRSTVTKERLTAELYAYSGGTNTIRGVHSALSVFLGHLTDIHGLWDVNPMLKVPKPATTRPVVRFLESEAVEQLIGYQLDAAHRIFYTIAYGTGIESGVILGLTRADVWDATQEIRAAGTKAHTRDRVAKVADWAWPAVAAYVDLRLPHFRLFPSEWRTDQVSHWHSDTLEALGLPHLPLHNARHHWAASRLRAGWPIELVQKQLGHSTPQITLQTYGQFRPTTEDRAHWEKQLTEYEERRKTGGRSAGRSAKPAGAPS